jgi:hypothetical protein
MDRVSLAFMLETRLSLRQTRFEQPYPRPRDPDVPAYIATTAGTIARCGQQATLPLIRAYSTEQANRNTA